MVGELPVVCFGHGLADGFGNLAEVEHPKDIGDRTTLAIMLALRERGLAVLVPFGENTRYDLVIDDGQKLRRVQCKTGRLRRGAILWNVCSHYGHHANPRQVRRDYQGEVDCFAVYCPETSGVYLIPMADVQIRVRGSLRVDPPKNGQRRFIRFAKPYEIGRVALGGQSPPSPLGGVNEVVPGDGDNPGELVL
jgi:hypothetical protein